MLGPSGYTADLTFHYVDPTDIPITANESNFVIQQYNGGFTQPLGVVDPTANAFHVSGITQLNGDWTLAEPAALGTPTPTYQLPTFTPTSYSHEQPYRYTYKYANGNSDLDACGT